MTRPGPKRKLSDEQELAIIRHYTETGENVLSMSKTLSIPRTTLQRTLARHGIATRPELARTYLDPAERVQAVEMCLGGHTREEVAQHFGVASQTVHRILQGHGAKMSIGPRPKPMRHDAFDEITPASAYWMGFLFADGHISRDQYGKNAIALNLGEGDREHVEKFRDFLGSQHAIVRITTKKVVGGPSAFFKVRSTQLTEALVARGFRQKNEDRAPVVELAQSRDFWRGVVDGDGTLGTIKNTYAAIWLYGHRNLLIGFRDWIFNQQFGDIQVSPKTNGSITVPSKIQIFQVAAGGTTAYRTIHALYTNAEIALSRKFDRAQSILRTAR